MTDIVAFLNARLDEDEALAKIATPGPWSYDPGKQWQDPGDGQFQGQECVTYGKPPRANSPAAFGPPLTSGGCVATTGPADDRPSMADAAHIARHDPARVLREVAAKRAIVWQWEQAAQRNHDDECDEAAGSAWAALSNTLVSLAGAYDSHPDYAGDRVEDWTWPDDDPAWTIAT